MSQAAIHTYEVEQPWVLYHYGYRHDQWWPFWSSSRVWGRAPFMLECMVCGKQKRVSLKIRRFRKQPDQGYHPARSAFLADHAHPDRGAPMSWAKPLANTAAHPGGMSLDGLAMRLEADINDAHIDGVEGAQTQ